MRYGEIIKFGFSKAWQYKSLWLLGLLAGGASFPDMNWAFNRQDNTIFGTSIEELIAQNLPLVLMIAAVLLFVGLCFFILSIIAQGGLIEAGGNIHRTIEYRFGQAFKAGALRFWAMLGITILLIIIVMAIILMLFLLGFITWKINLAVFLLSLVILIPILIFSVFYTTMSFALAQRALIIERLGVFDAIGEGVTLLNKNFVSSIVIALIGFAIGIAMFFVVLAIMASIVLPFVAIGLAGHIVMAFALGIPVLFLVMLVFQGYTGAANSLLMTAFYMELPNRTPLTAHAAPPVSGPDSGYTPPPTVGPYPPAQPSVPPPPPVEPLPPMDVPPPDDPHSAAPPTPPENDEPPPPPQQG